MNKYFWLTTVKLGERDGKNISYRTYGSEDTNTLSQEDFISKLLDEIKNKTR